MNKRITVCVVCMILFVVLTWRWALSPVTLLADVVYNDNGSCEKGTAERTAYHFFGPVLLQKCYLRTESDQYTAFHSWRKVEAICRPLLVIIVGSVITFVLLRRRENVNHAPEDTARKLADPQH